jgi:cell volume regulation protein A
MLVVRDQHVLTADEASTIREGDHVYFLAPPEKAHALDRFFVEMPPPTAPDPELLGDFFVSGDVTLGALAEIYGLEVQAVEAGLTLADYFATRFGRSVRLADVLPVGSIALVAHQVANGRVATVGLRLAEADADAGRSIKRKLVRLRRRIGARLRMARRKLK